MELLPPVAILWPGRLTGTGRGISCGVVRRLTGLNGCGLRLIGGASGGRIVLHCKFGFRLFKQTACRRQCARRTGGGTGLFRRLDRLACVAHFLRRNRGASRENEGEQDHE